jgi:hypothetical protein
MGRSGSLARRSPVRSPVYGTVFVRNFAPAAQLSPFSRLKSSMKNSYLPHPSLTFVAAAVAAVGLMFTSSLAQAQTTKTIKGHFHSTDGNSGSFVETVDTDGDVVTTTVVYTRNSDKETSTDISTVTGKDTGVGTYTVAYSHTDYGTTAAYTSNRTVDYVKGGGHVGTGTYTTAAGVTGTFRTLETFVNEVKITSFAYLPATGTGINELRVEEDEFGFTAVRDLTLDATGKATTVYTIRHHNLLP